MDELIRKAQSGDGEALLILLKRFLPLLRKYANKLNYEDAFFDMQLCFIELILTWDLCILRNKSEGALVKYISSSLYHAFCKLVGMLTSQKQENVSVDVLVEKQSLALSTSLYHSESSWKLPTYPKGLLTRKEEVIIRLIYETGYSAAEISRALNVSRQSVNQCKKRAEKKLLKYYS